MDQKTNADQLIESLYQSLGLAIEERDAEPTPSGGIALATGTHLLQIKTPKQPLKVFVSLEDGNYQVCGTDEANTVSVAINADHFILGVVIHSDSATVSWLVTYGE